MEINESVIHKLIEVVDVGLVKGLGVPEPGKMCVEAAVCYALNLPYGDKPECVAPVIRTYKIALNDKWWSSEAARAKGLRRAAVAQLGSSGINQVAWINLVVDQIIKQIVPIALRAAAKLVTNPRPLLEAATRCELEGTEASAHAAATAAHAAVTAAATAAYAADAAATAADAAATAAYAAYDRDNVLSIAAEIGVQACVTLGTEGSKWLYLLD